MMDYVLIVEAAILWVPMLLSFWTAGKTQTAALALEKPARMFSSAELHEVGGRVFRYFIVLALLAIIIRTLGAVDDTFHLILLNRYSLFVASLLVGLVPLGRIVVPGVLGNLFVLRDPWQLFNVTWLAFLTAVMLVVVTRVVEVNAPGRYRTNPVVDLHESWGVIRTLAVLLLAIPIPLACALSSQSSKVPGLSWAWAVLGGAAVAFALLIMVCIVGEIFVPGPRIDNLLPLQAQIRDLLSCANIKYNDALNHVFTAIAHATKYIDSHGYVSHPDWPGQSALAAGHAQALGAAVIVVVYYMSTYLVMRWREVVLREDSYFTSIFYVVLILLMTGFVFQGVSFALDRHFVSALLALFIFSFAVYQFNRTDHFVNLNPADNRKCATAVTAQSASEALQEPPSLLAAANAWKIPAESALVDPATGKPVDGERNKRTLVAVTAAGGGIQASAWTTQALVGLHRLYGDKFTRSIGIMSGVSGGSVGLMYYLDRWNNTGTVFDAEAIAVNNGLPVDNSICANAMASSLEATAWGLAFPDLMRTVFPVFVSRTDDRGSRIEDAWRDHLHNPDARLTDWFDAIAAGQKPIPVFNSTIVETGQRMLFSPVRSGHAAASPESAQELFGLYPTARPRVSTTVRLSATFPFVSPICRPLASSWPKENNYHYCDGGYVDNEGMVTIIEWLQRVLVGIPKAERGALFDQIVIVRLLPFPVQTTIATAALNKGWFYALFGPLDAIANVRVASQSERNNLAVELFQLAATLHDVPVHTVTLSYEMPGGMNPPLSWMLTQQQKGNITAAWELARQCPGKRLLDSIFS